MALSRGRVGAEMSLPALGSGRWDTDRCGALATGPVPSWARPVHGLTQTPVRWLSPVFQLRDAGSAAHLLGTAPSSRAGLGVPDRRPCCRAQVRPRAEPAFRHGVGAPRHPNGAEGVPESPLVSGGGRGAARSLAGVTFSRVSVLTTLCSSTDSAPSPPAKPPPPTVADLVDVCPRQPAPHARQPSWPGRELGSACGGLSGGRGVRVSRSTKPARPGPGSAPECGGAGSSDRCPLLWTCRGGSQRRCLSERGPPWPLGPSAPRQGGGSSAEGAVPGLKSEAVARPGDKPAPCAVPPGDKGVLGGRGQVRKGRRAVAGAASSSFLVVTTQCRSRRPRVRGP